MGAGWLAAAGTGSQFGWQAEPTVWLVMLILILGYVTAVRLVGPRRVPYGRRPASGRQQVLFFSGVAALWLGADWPMHELSEQYLFSAHMVQHMLFTFVAPPLLLMGLPAWLLEDLLAPPLLRRVVGVMTRPLVALIVFNFVIALTHWPAVVNLSLESEPAHFIIHSVLFLTATFMWWPVVDPLPLRPSLSPPAKMLYLFLQSVVPTVPASFLTFADTPIYSFYAHAPRLWSGFDVVTDQRIAGLIMKLGGGLLLWTVIAIMFFRWNAAEESNEDDLITWDDFERELEAWDLRK